MARCMKCGRSDKVMCCICQDCLAQAGWPPADQLPPLFTRCEPDEDDGHLVTYQISDPVLVWCRDREYHTARQTEIEYTREQILRGSMYQETWKNQALHRNRGTVWGQRKRR